MPYEQIINNVVTGAVAIGVAKTGEEIMMRPLKRTRKGKRKKGLFL